MRGVSVCVFDRLYCVAQQAPDSLRLRRNLNACWLPAVGPHHTSMICYLSQLTSHHKQVTCHHIPLTWILKQLTCHCKQVTFSP